MSLVTHEVHRVPTYGQTEVGDPDNHNEPFLLDPAHLNNGANGTYKVIPIDLQVNDWQDDDDGGNSGSNQQSSTSTSNGQPNDISVDKPEQIGVIGDMVDSTLKGQKGAQRHFVTPRLSQAAPPDQQKEFVTIRSQLPKAELQGISEYRWAITSDTGENPGVETEVVATETFNVYRENAGKTRVTLRKKDKSGDASKDQDIGTINVWVVWCDKEMTKLCPSTGNPITERVQCIGDYDSGIALKFRTALNPVPIGNDDGYIMKFTVRPSTITDVNQDIPNLSGPSNPLYPPSPHNEIHYMHRGRSDEKQYYISDGAPDKWDVSQSVREHLSNPMKFPRSRMADGSGIMYDHQATEDDTVIDFPVSDTEGNDDYKTARQQSNPYKVCMSPEDLKHGIGCLIEADSPVMWSPVELKTKNDQANYNNATFEDEADFATFVRLQIGTKWYRVSNHLNWYMTLRAIYRNGTWGNNGSSTGLSPDSN